MSIKPNIGHTVNRLSNSIDKMSKDLEELKELMLKLWKAEDEEENAGIYRWPYDKNGELLPNVTMSNKI